MSRIEENYEITYKNKTGIYKLMVEAKTKQRAYNYFKAQYPHDKILHVKSVKVREYEEPIKRIIGKRNY